MSVNEAVDVDLLEKPHTTPSGRGAGFDRGLLESWPFWWLIMCLFAESEK